MSYRFDVVLSFAGEQRGYVEQVAQLLQENNVNVFYDEFNEVELWGKDLIEHFDKTYHDQGQHCVMFISKDYVEKNWPSHERRSAFARALRDCDYLLPVRFDDTRVLGLPDTVFFMDARKKTPEELASAIIQKASGASTLGSIPVSVKYRTPKRQQTFNPYEEALKWISFISSELKKREKQLGPSISISAFERDGKNCIRVVNNSETVYSLDITHGAFSSDKGLSFYGVNGEIRGLSSGYNAFGEFRWNQEKEDVSLELHDMSFLESFSSDKKSFTQEEFLEAIWGKICDAIERPR